MSNSLPSSDENTLLNLITSGQLPVFNNSTIHINIHTGKISTADNQTDKINTLSNTGYSISQLLGQEWVIPSCDIANNITHNNNSGKYIYIKVEYGKAGYPAILVLCKEFKDTYPDGSYKLHYVPVDCDSVKRM